MKIGATALCRWTHEEEEWEYYFSFGEYDPETEQDGFGVNDGDVFFYCSEGELLAMVGGDSKDFQVIKILYYKEKGAEILPEIDDLIKQKEEGEGNE